MFLLVCEIAAMKDGLEQWWHFGVTFLTALGRGAFWFYLSRMLTKYQTFYLDGLSAFEAYRYVFIEISFSLFSNIHLSGRVFAAASKERIKKLVGWYLCCLGCSVLLWVDFYVLVRHEFILRGIPLFEDISSLASHFQQQASYILFV